ncbi:LEAF RUST 10 DISEASE-RESISTANCE LOCUS RECEPTOR-LIKE PROTEIN KINASE-like 2.8, partial [Prosopis cineraria]|uniref:LEAF RUST 10 DISEASE-RESISTANCE LOCUS RECEPTOR-LIKE PROTEIN KINASE-like 2.8 n=1 Tax=Prosopis cineraria TaxID=364024 RepID=UPI00240F50EF
QLSLSFKQPYSLRRQVRFRPEPDTVVLFFDCDTSSLPDNMRENRVGCSEGNRTRSVLGLAVDDDQEKLKYAKDNCRHGNVKTTVVENVEGGIGEALGRGFVLTLANWTVNKCDACLRSGGRCGFEFNDYGFRCHCPDGDNYLMCHSGLSLSLSLSLSQSQSVSLLSLLFLWILISHGSFFY